MRTEVTPQKINKVMESRFGFSIDYDNLTYAKAERLRNAIGENIVAIKKSFGAHTAEKNSKYMELMLVKEGLDKWLGSEQGLFESEMGRSEAVLAAKDIVDSVQDMLEKISKIQNEQVPALIDTIRDQIGSEQAEQFKGAISPMLVELYSALSTAREGSDTAVRQLAGEDVGQSMDMNMGGGDAGLVGDSDFDDEDMFGAEPAAAGGAVGDLDQPELGRERRDMSESQRRKMDEMFAFDTKGKDRGPRDTGSDELARRAKLGKNPITRHAPDYKAKDKYGDRYNVAGPKGKLPEGDMEEGRVEMPSSTVKSVYYPDKAQSPIKKSRFAYDAQGETNFKKYPDQTSRPAGMNPDPASRHEMDEADMEEGNDFTGSRLASIKAGKPTFSVGGKTYRVTGNTSDETRTRK
jgi:hypothetical protein